MSNGLPKKYAKLGFAKGWKAWKRAKAAAKSARKKVSKIVKKKTTKKKTVKKVNKKSTKRSGVAMANKKKAVKKYASKAVTKIKYRNKKVKPLDLLINALLASAGGIVSSLAINKLPMLKSLDPLAKSGIQIGTGLALLYFGPDKFKLVKLAGTGTVMAGTFGLVQKTTKQDVLAGEEELTQAEINALIGAGVLNGPEVMRALNGPAMMSNQMDGNPALMGNPAMMGEGNFTI